jgi:hypothetical protein
VDIAKAIIDARDSGHVRCGFSTRVAPSVVELAREFALRDDASIYHEIAEADARTLVRVALRRDLAYGAELMAEGRAATLADDFIAAFGGTGVRYFSNGSWHLPPVVASDGRSGHGPGWTPATAATFDTGVLVIGPARSGCFWVEDED